MFSMCSIAYDYADAYKDSHVRTYKILTVTFCDYQPITVAANPSIMMTSQICKSTKLKHAST